MSKIIKYIREITLVEWLVIACIAAILWGFLCDPRCSVSITSKETRP